MKVGSLFAEIGFKVDESGLEKFSNAMKAFQKTIREGLKDLKEYAKVAREITQAMKEAYVPTQQEARARYRANTRYISSQARRGNADSKYIRAEATNLAAQAALANEKTRLLERQTKVKESNAESRAAQIKMKQEGLIGTHTGRYSAGLKKLVAGIFGLNLGGILGGIGGLVGGGIGSIIMSAIAKLISTMWTMTKWLGSTFMQGIKFGLAYRDYRTFTGRSAKGLSNIMMGALNATNMSPEDVMRDVAGLEKSYWDIFFGEGNPRAWQALGITPTGIGDVDIYNILSSIFSLNNRGLQRKLLGDFHLSEDYLNIKDYLEENGKFSSAQDLLDAVLTRVDDIEDANRIIKKFSWELDTLKISIVSAVRQSGLLETLERLEPFLKELEPVINQIVKKLAIGLDKILQVLPSLLEKLNQWLGEKLLTPEQQEEYRKLKHIEELGEEGFNKRLGMFAKSNLEKKMWERGDYMSALFGGMGREASDAAKMAYIYDTFHITVTPQDLPKVYDTLVQKKSNYLNEAFGTTDATVAADTTM